MEYNELYHWGIKGQRWGVRRYQNPDGSLTPAGKKRYQRILSDDAKEAQKLRNKSVGEMTNAELRKLNERQQLERMHAQLNPSVIRRGLAVVGTTTTTLGSILTLYNNGDKIFSIGKNAVDKVIKKANKVIKKIKGGG